MSADDFLNFVYHSVMIAWTPRNAIEGDMDAFYGCIFDIRAQSTRGGPAALHIVLREQLQAPSNTPPPSRHPPKTRMLGSGVRGRLTAAPPKACKFPKLDPVTIKVVTHSQHGTHPSWQAAPHGHLTISNNGAAKTAPAMHKCPRTYPWRVFGQRSRGVHVIVSWLPLPCMPADALRARRPVHLLAPPTTHLSG